MKSSWKRLPLMSMNVETRAWLPQIVRNTCDTWLEKNRPLELSLEFDERFHLPTCDIPETIKIAGGGRRSLVLALETLPPRFCDTAKEVSLC